MTGSANCDLSFQGDKRFFAEFILSLSKGWLLALCPMLHALCFFKSAVLNA